ncbi:MAG: DUF2062 domain-containing protein [Natronomonas sp.]|uniref:DUF2062 domain-containing protein n=1 Tax=Natronomonas sp. TaxID=2184060 RepID=UPI0028703681|nr:DUF2062 domain-containing protein [Natronomonas sp.]MDR9382105.1 DUF2062 domain-containing protein [Natronomonas sp.]MDR9430264.1 DUF2062 domain-containing protein [Natronomonas sp.]
MDPLRAYVRSTRAELKGELEASLDGEYTPQQVAGSFALGVFITALPTLGTGFLLFVLIAYLFSGVSKLALFSSVIVLNPAVKWGVYGTSFWLGSVLLGPVDGVSRSELSLSLSAAPEVVARLLLGNLILAVLFTVVGYAAAYRLTAAYRRRSGEIGVVEGALERVRNRP